VENLRWLFAALQELPRRMRAIAACLALLLLAVAAGELEAGVLKAVLELRGTAVPLGEDQVLQFVATMDLASRAPWQLVAQQVRAQLPARAATCARAAPPAVRAAR
jgi:hypothetical protein